MLSSITGRTRNDATGRLAIIAAAAGKDLETLLESIKRDFWLNAKEACEYGLIDQVLSSHAELPE